MEKISISTAQQVMLAAQGLDRAPDRPAVKADVLETVRRMGVLQIDTIHVVRRSPYLVLWSRLGDYRPEWLDELHAEGPCSSIGRTPCASCRLRLTRSTAGGCWMVWNRTARLTSGQ
jgi:hypothetical protein